MIFLRITQYWGYVIWNVETLPLSMQKIETRGMIRTAHEWLYGEAGIILLGFLKHMWALGNLPARQLSGEEHILLPVHTNTLNIRVRDQEILGISLKEENFLFK